MEKYKVRFYYYVDVVVDAESKNDAYDRAMAVVNSNSLDDIAEYDGEDIIDVVDKDN